MLTRHFRKLLWGLTVRLAAGFVRPVHIDIISSDGWGCMSKQKQPAIESPVITFIFYGLFLALALQLFFRIIS